MPAAAWVRLWRKDAKHSVIGHLLPKYLLIFLFCCHIAEFSLGCPDPRAADLCCRKTPYGLFRQVLQSAARIICAPAAHKFYTPQPEKYFHFIWRLTPPNSARLFGQVASTALTPGQQIFRTIQRMFYGFWFKNSFASVFFCEKGEKSLCNVLCYASLDCGFSL